MLGDGERGISGGYRQGALERTDFIHLAKQKSRKQNRSKIEKEHAMPRQRRRKRKQDDSNIRGENRGRKYP